MNRPPPSARTQAELALAGSRPVLITGGAGFIGTNLAQRYLSAGRPELIFDNLSRPDVERNVRWLCETHGELVQLDLGTEILAQFNRPVRGNCMPVEMPSSPDGFTEPAVARLLKT